MAGVPGVTPFALGVLQFDRKAVSLAGEEVRVGQRQQMHADIAGDVALLVTEDETRLGHLRGTYRIHGGRSSAEGIGSRTGIAKVRPAGNSAVIGT
ncbi:hypothetical protein D3C76_1585270 [compost metagenome]